MRRVTRFHNATFAPLLLCALPVSAQQLTVVNRVPISPLGNGAHWWVNVATDPGDANRLIACATRTVAPTANVWSSVYTSTNGGASWTETLTDSSSRWVTETSCAMGPGGAAYLVTGASHEVDGTLEHQLGRMNLFRSSDKGRSWVLVNVRPFADYTASIVNIAPGPEYGRLIIATNKVSAARADHWSQPMAVLSSSDLGETLAPPVGPSPSPVVYSNTGTYPTGITLLSDGRAIVVYAVAHGSPDPEAVSPRSYQIALVARDGAAIEHLRPVPETSMAMGTPTIAADRSGRFHPARLYLTWTEKQEANERIVLASSNDEGVTWTRRAIREHGIGVALNDHAGMGAAMLNPAVAVNGAGDIGLVWTDRSSGCTRFAASMDGGASFSRPIKLSRCNGRAPSGRYLERALYPLNIGRSPGGITLAAQFNFGGSWEFGQTNLAADAAGRFHPVWAEPEDLGYQLWTGTVTVGASNHTIPVTREGLIDITSAVGVITERAGYAEADTTFFLDVRLVNRGTVPIQAPLVVEGGNLASPYGAVRFANADNATTGDGALWSATALLPDQGLMPGATSDLLHIAVRLEELRPLRVPTWDEAFSADFRVFAPQLTEHGPAANQE